MYVGQLELTSRYRFNIDRELQKGMFFFVNLCDKFVLCVGQQFSEVDLPSCDPCTYKLGVTKLRKWSGSHCDLVHMVLCQLLLIPIQPECGLVHLNPIEELQERAVS